MARPKGLVNYPDPLLFDGDVLDLDNHIINPGEVWILRDYIPFPDAQCMAYLPTFWVVLGGKHVGKHTIH